MDKFSEIIALPKGDLHLHLNGAVPTEIVKNLLEMNSHRFRIYLDLYHSHRYLTNFLSVLFFTFPKFCATP